MIKRETRKEAAGAALLGLVLAGAAQPVAGVELEPPAPADPIELFLAAETPPRRAAVAGAAQDAPREAGGQGGDVAASGAPGGGAGSVVLVRKPGSGRSGAGGAPERREVEIRLKPADDSITRKSDGGLVLAGLPGFSLVGFYGYGGFEKGGGYHFTGTGYMGVDGISRIIPASLLLAGFTADPRQSIYSAEMRAETPVALSPGVELVPYAGFRAVLSQDAENGLGGLGSQGSGAEADRRSVQQIPVGIGLRIDRRADARTRYRIKSALGAVANLGDAGTGAAEPGGQSFSGSSVTGIGSVGIELERGLWSFGAGADVGVSSEDRTETGLSINLKHKF